MQTQGLVAESLVSPKECCAGLFNHGGKASEQLQLFWGSNCWVPQSTQTLSMLPAASPTQFGQRKPFSLCGSFQAAKD